jgi:hypothetical protein
VLTAEARVETELASRHLAQLCRHASRMDGHLRHRARAHSGGHAAPEVRYVECSDARGTIDFGLGRCVLDATPDALTLHVEAEAEADLRRLQDLVAHRLEAIGSRDGLKVTWQRAAVTAEPRAEATSIADGQTSKTTTRGPGVTTLVLAAAAALAVAVHLGVFGAALAAWKGTSWGADIVLALVVLLVAVVGLKTIAVGRMATRHDLHRLIPAAARRLLGERR